MEHFKFQITLYNTIFEFIKKQQLPYGNCCFYGSGPNWA